MTNAVANTENLSSVDLKTSIADAVEEAKVGNQYDVHAEIAAINKMAADDEVEGHMRAAVRIERMVRLVREIAKSPDADAAFDEARKQRQVYPEQPGKNPYYPLVRVCEGSWDRNAVIRRGIRTPFSG